jgi:hypothetical protein
LRERGCARPDIAAFRRRVRKNRLSCRKSFIFARLLNTKKVVGRTFVDGLKSLNASSENTIYANYTYEIFAVKTYSLRKRVFLPVWYSFSANLVDVQNRIGVYCASMLHVMVCIMLHPV